MSELGSDLIEGLNEAIAFSRGDKAGAVVHTVGVQNVRTIRRSLRMSQQRFAETYRIPLPTLKNWEQGRRVPDAPAAAYLQAISQNPDAIREALQVG